MNEELKPLISYRDGKNFKRATFVGLLKQGLSVEIKMRHYIHCAKIFTTLDNFVSQAD